MPKDENNLFDSLAKHRQKAEPLKQLPDELPKRSRPVGKRSDPDYIQVGAYIRKDVERAVKRKLLDDDRDFSDLVGELLERWLKESGD